MSRNRNRQHTAASLNQRAHETPTTQEPTDESVVRGMDHEAPRTLRTGFRLVGSEVLDAIGSGGAVGRAMHDVIHSPDDEKMATRLGPEQEASVSFHPDHALGDAGAEFAEEFGRDFLRAATTGEDIDEIYSASAGEVDGREPVLQEMGMSMLDDLTDDAEPIEDDAPPSKAR